MEYAITIRKTRRPVTKQHYYDYLDKIADLGSIGNVNFETKKGLHTHFILKTALRLNYNDLRPTKRGWNAKAVPVYNRKGWISYSRKDRYQGTNDPHDPDSQPPPKYNLFKCCSNNTISQTN